MEVEERGWMTPEPCPQEEAEGYYVKLPGRENQGGAWNQLNETSYIFRVLPLMFHVSLSITEFSLMNSLR